MPPRPAHRTLVITPRLLVWLIGGLLAAALVGGSIFLALVPGAGGVVIEDAAGTTDGAASDTGVTDSIGQPAVTIPSADLVVDVEGAVAHPGLVHVPVGGRVGDALTRAGGFAPTADLTRTASDLNLAQTVTDGLKVVVPIIGQTSTGTQSTDTGAGDTGSASGAATGSGPLDLNQATEAQLDTLPGVGAATIAKIFAARQSAPFTSTEDLRTRKVVGDAAFEKLKGLITVGH